VIIKQYQRFVNKNSVNDCLARENVGDYEAENSGSFLPALLGGSLATEQELILAGLWTIAAEVMKFPCLSE